MWKLLRNTYTKNVKPLTLKKHLHKKMWSRLQKHKKCETFKETPTHKKCEATPTQKMWKLLRNTTQKMWKLLRNTYTKKCEDS